MNAAPERFSRASSLLQKGHTEPGRGAEWWGKSLLLTFGWAGIPALFKSEPL
jgi:hypothetical protein